MNVILYSYKNGRQEIEINGHTYTATKIRSGEIQTNCDIIPTHFVEWELKPTKPEGKPK